MKFDYSERFLRSFEDAPLRIQKAFTNRRSFCYRIFGILHCTRRNTTRRGTFGKRESRVTGVSTSASKAIPIDFTTSLRIRNRSGCASVRGQPHLIIFALSKFDIDSRVDWPCLYETLLHLPESSVAEPETRNPMERSRPRRAKPSHNRHQIP